MYFSLWFECKKNWRRKMFSCFPAYRDNWLQICLMMFIMKSEKRPEKRDHAIGAIYASMIYMAPGLGSRIPDPKTAAKERGEKNLLFCGHRFHIIVLFYFLNAEEKNLSQFSKSLGLFTQKIVTKLSKIWTWDPGSGTRDPGSGIRKKPIPDPGSQIQGSKKHQIRNTGPRNAISAFSCS